VTSKAKTNPFTFRVTWKPFTQQDITWVQRFISLLPNNPELRFFKRAASRVHITNSGEARYVDSLNEFIYEEDDVLVLGDYTITKSITTTITETATKTTRREKFLYMVHEPDADEMAAHELGEADSLAGAVKMIFLHEYEALFDMMVVGMQEECV